MPTTWSPRARSASATWEPMKPAAPVIKIVIQEPHSILYGRFFTADLLGSISYGGLYGPADGVAPAQLGHSPSDSDAFGSRPCHRRGGLPDGGMKARGSSGGAIPTRCHAMMAIAIWLPSSARVVIAAAPSIPNAGIMTRFSVMLAAAAQPSAHSA